MRPDATRDEGLRELGVHDRMRKITYFPSGQPRLYGEVVELFEAYKVELRSRKKQFALELHPDANLNETEKVREARAQKFKRVIRAIDYVVAQDISPPRPQLRVVQVIMVRPVAGGFSSGASTQTTTAGAFWNNISSR